MLADLGGIYKWNPGVTHSRSTSDSTGGEGAMRHCDLQRKGDYLEERAFDWRDGEGYKIDVYETNLPLKRNIVEFTLEANGESTTVTVTPDYELKFGPIGAMMDMLFARAQLRKGMDGMLAGLKYHVETGEVVGDSVPTA